jgi:undecaprenyl-diphosphatase
MSLIAGLQSLDERLFLALNGTHTPLLDAMMWYASKMLFWLPVYVLLLVTMYRRMSGARFISAIIGLAFLLFLTDFVAVQAVKETVQRLRPSHNPALEHLVHLVKDDNGQFYRGGRYGFFSNHASNYAGVCAFFILLMRPLKRLAIAALIAWVVLISYSRIYLGVHYPFDILAGWIYGAACGWLVFLLVNRLTKNSTVS